jgi:hypothetical protein
MRPENPVWWGGLAAFVAGLLVVLSDLLRIYIELIDPGAFLGMNISIMGGFGVDGALGVLLAAMMQLGLVGLYASRAKALGVLGAIGLFLATIGVQLSMGSSFVFAFIRAIVWPWETGEYFEEPFGSVAVLALSFALGCVLLGVAMLRGNSYPRVAVSLFIAGALVLILPLPLDDVIFGGTMAWLGYILLREGSRRGQVEGMVTTR